MAGTMGIQSGLTGRIKQESGFVRASEQAEVSRAMLEDSSNQEDEESTFFVVTSFPNHENRQKENS